MKKRFLCMILAALLLASAFTGCGETESEQESDAGAVR